MTKACNSLSVTSSYRGFEKQNIQLRCSTARPTIKMFREHDHAKANNMRKEAVLPPVQAAWPSHPEWCRSKGFVSLSLPPFLISSYCSSYHRSGWSAISGKQSGLFPLLPSMRAKRKSYIPNLFSLAREWQPLPLQGTPHCCLYSPTSVFPSIRSRCRNVEDLSWE